MEWNWLRPSSTSSGSSSGASSSSSSGGGGPFGRPAAASRKQLVGFARATGDNSLVATVYDVAVHPSMRGLGIGHRLVKLLLQQVQARAVYDIGVITPCSLGGFWERCSFEDDREDSTYMVFTGRSSTSSSSRNGGCSSSSSNGAGGHGASWADDVSDGSERAASGEGSGSLGLWSQQQPQQEQEVEDDAGLRRGSWEWREGTGSGEASDLAVAAAAAASRVQYGSQQWSDVSGGSSGGDSDGFDAGGHSNWGQQEPGQQRQQQQHEEAGWGVGGLEGPGGMLDECGCWTPHTTQALLERADLGHWAAAQQSESLRRLLDAKLQRLKEGGGRAGEPGAGTAAAARARGPRWTGLGGRSRGVPALPSPGNGVGLGGNSGNGSG